MPPCQDERLSMSNFHEAISMSSPKAHDIRMMQNILPKQLVWYQDSRDRLSRKYSQGFKTDVFP